MTNPESLEIGIKLIHHNARMPEFSHIDDACADLYAAEEEIILPQSIALVKTGVVMEIPSGYEGQVRPRSGLAAKHGIGILNSPGTIDAGYRGEIKIILINLGTEEFEVKLGDRIAQIGIRRVPEVSFVLKSSLSDTERGEGGFGSTGIRGPNSTK